MLNNASITVSTCRWGTRNCLYKTEKPKWQAPTLLCLVLIFTSDLIIFEKKKWSFFLLLQYFYSFHFFQPSSCLPCQPTMGKTGDAETKSGFSLSRKVGRWLIKLTQKKSWQHANAHWRQATALRPQMKTTHNLICHSN